MSDIANPADPLATPDTSASRDPTSAAQASARRGPRTWLWLLIALLIAGLAFWLWRQASPGHAPSSATSAQTLASLDAEEVRNRIDALVKGRAALERRIAAVESVNRSLREQVLGANERANLLEDAVARIADRDLAGSAQLKLNEAEFLLSMAEERISLFGDVAGAVRSFALADAELAALEDPRFAGVRQALAVERETLGALDLPNRNLLLAELDQVGQSMRELNAQPRQFAPAPVPAPAPSEPAPAVGFGTRLRVWTAHFVRVERVDVAADQVRLDSGTRAMAAEVEVLRATAALSLLDYPQFKHASARAAAAIRDGYGDSAQQRVLIQTLDDLAATPLPELPQLGDALKRLRNLRTAHSLSGQQTFELPPAPAAAPAPEPNAVPLPQAPNPDAAPPPQAPSP